MTYEINISDDNLYIHAQITCLMGVTLETFVEFTREFASLGDRHKIHKCIINVCGVATVSRITEQYVYAYEEAEKAGLKYSWQIALLKDEDDSTPDFLATVMRNAGYFFQIFTEKSEAEAWLKSPGALPKSA